MHRGACRRPSEPLHRGELHRLARRDLARDPIADHDLQRGGDCGGRERDRERRPLVTAAPSTQEAPSVNARHEETGDDVAGEVHVHELVPEVRIAEERRPRLRVDRPAIAQIEAAGVVHPTVDRDDEERPGDPRDHDRNAGEEVPARRQPVPSVDVDRDEDRLDEEGEPLEHEAQPEHVAEGGHETRPQQAELEAEDRTRDDADREQREHHLRPAPRDRAEERVPGTQVAPLHEQDHRRKRDAKADQGDVHRERERLHLPSLEQVVLLDRREGGGRGREDRRYQLRYSAITRLGVGCRATPSPC